MAASHGADKIDAALQKDASLDLTWLSTPGKDRYATSRNGFWGAYFGSELTLRMLAYEAIPTPGAACTPAAVEPLRGIFDLASQDIVSRAQLEAAQELCLCRMPGAADGAWMRAVLSSRSVPDSETKSDLARRGTISLLARVIDTGGGTAATGGGVTNMSSVFAETVAYGPWLLADPVSQRLEVSQPWRGMLLRNYSVGAWRRLWAWLVEHIDGLTKPDVLRDAWADAMPTTSVRQMMASLPATQSADGSPAAVEVDLRKGDLPLPLRELLILALGSRRASELTGVAGDAFRGGNVELGPQWMSARLARCQEQQMSQFAHDLAADLLIRARRVALNKMIRNPDGTIGLPTRVHERAGLLYKIGEEGAGDVGIRIGSLGSVLAGAGVVALNGDTWQLTAEGRASLG